LAATATTAADKWLAYDRVSVIATTGLLSTDPDIATASTNPTITAELVTRGARSLGLTWILMVGSTNAVDHGCL
jgi:hypothetical protein